jgi:RHS repeat-associated protein
MGRLTALDHKKGTNFLAAYDYTYDAGSRITSIDSLTDGLSTFTYDVTNQLTDADHASQPDEDYSFDLNGNRTMTGHTVGTNNRISTDGTYNFTYDNEGNRTSQTKISTGEVTEYEWDHRNRLTKVTQKNSGGTIVKTTEHSYDVYDRWVRRRVDPDGAGAAAAVDAFFAHDGDQIALVFDGPAASNLDNRLLWGPMVDQLLADEDVSTLTSAGDVIWPLSDHLGTPRDLAQYNSGTDTTSVVNHRIYEAFGALVSQSNASFSILIGFTGRPYDDSTGLQNNWHRWYVSTSGVWLSEDPLGFGGRDASLVRYVLNDPSSATDPTGEFLVPVLIVVVIVLVAFTPEVVNAPAPNDATHGPWGNGQLEENATAASIILPAAGAPTIAGAACAMGKELIEEAVGVPTDLDGLAKQGDELAEQGAKIAKDSAPDVGEKALKEGAPSVADDVPVPEKGNGPIASAGPASPDEELVPVGAPPTKTPP